MPNFCTNCGKPMEFENTEICPFCGMRFQLPSSSAPTKIRRPGIAALLSFFFVGWGHWYNGRKRDGLKFFGTFLGSFSLMFILAIIMPNADQIVLLLFAILIGIWIYSMYDAYTVSKKINRGELEFSRKSRLFWFPVALIILAVYVMIFTVIIAASVFGMSQPGQSYPPIAYPPVTYPTIHPYTPQPTPVQVPYFPIKIPTIPPYVPIKIPTIAPYRPAPIPTIAPYHAPTIAPYRPAPIPTIAPYRPMRY